MKATEIFESMAGDDCDRMGFSIAFQEAMDTAMQNEVDGEITELLEYALRIAKVHGY